MIKDLYEEGLLFLKDLSDAYGSDQGAYEVISQVLFDGEVTKYKIKTIKYLQRNGLTNYCLKLVSSLAINSYKKFGAGVLPISVSTNCTSNTKLLPYIETALNAREVTATICLKRLVVPIFIDDTYMQKTLNLLQRLRTEVGKVWVTEKVFIEMLLENFSPIYYFPNEDKDEPFIYINTSEVVAVPYNVIGSFSTTNKCRAAIIGCNYYFEYIDGSVLYQVDNIDMRKSRDRKLLLNLILKTGASLDKTVLLTEFQETKKGVYICQKI